MSQKVLVNGFTWVEDLSEFNEDFIKSCNGKSNEGYFFEADVQYHYNLQEPHNNFQFLPEIKKDDEVKKTCSELA